MCHMKINVFLAKYSKAYPPKARMPMSIRFFVHNSIIILEHIVLVHNLKALILRYLCVRFCYSSLVDF